MVLYAGISTVCFFVGYKSVSACLVMAIIRALAAAVINSLLFFFTPDCVEYGRYTSGISAPGISFPIQTFSVKLMAAISAAAAALGIIGFVEGEGAVQAADFADKLWALNYLVPIAACLASIPILGQYKLRDIYVKVMRIAITA
jgi:Na+/melibiose symporter-like transporter